jgi:hypothetical protein
MALKFQKSQLQASYARIYPGGIPASITNALKQFPLTVETLHKWFPLSVNSKLYASCPTCSCIYPPKRGIYPILCTYDEYAAQREKLRAQATPETTGPKKRTPKSTRLEYMPCNTVLMHDPQQPTRPIRPFKVRSFRDWLSKLLAQPGPDSTVMTDSFEIFGMDRCCETSVARMAICFPLRLLTKHILCSA